MRVAKTAKDKSSDSQVPQIKWLEGALAEERQKKKKNWHPKGKEHSPRN